MGWGWAHDTHEYVSPGQRTGDLSRGALANGQGVSQGAVVGATTNPPPAQPASQPNPHPPAVPSMRTHLEVHQNLQMCLRDCARQAEVSEAINVNVVIVRADQVHHANLAQRRRWARYVARAADQTSG